MLNLHTCHYSTKFSENGQSNKLLKKPECLVVYLSKVVILSHSRSNVGFDWTSIQNVRLLFVYVINVNDVTPYIKNA